MQFVNNDSNDYKFTGKKRDPETGLDYFGARYYSNAMGRWVSADWSMAPVPVPYADLTDPQTLNLYGYVRGLPTTRVDIDGHGFWRKLWNLASDAYGCFCEDDENKKHIEEAQKQAQRSRQAEIRRHLRFKQTHGRTEYALYRIFSDPDMVGGISAGFSIPEQAIADWLLASGEVSTVTSIATSDTAKTADALLNGTVTAEFKTLTEVGPNTLKNAIENAAQQGEKIIVDARNVPLDKAGAAAEIARAQGNIGGLEGRVTVITKEGAVKF